MNFSKNLKNLRENANLNQKELAVLLNVKTDTVSKWEQNKNIKTFELLEQLTKIFNCTYDDLLEDK
ncbi:MAG: helix-turn-helix domain-containing protein [Roseburia sp.]|nr:helix-turn-helix domain-containing protein [Roseburia sp.]MCM1556288.1 helix-turn-helix domain-containing protein [Anaeroplasma bactoclasticum]